MRRLNSPSQTKPVRDMEPGCRAAFTLIELMIVISIILVLMALISPALQAVFTKAKEAQVRTEITGLGNACDGFKGSHNHYPPSFIRLHETAAGWNGDPQSKRTIRRLYGIEFDFNFTGYHDIDGSGNSNGPHNLTGAECLVFFLGGLPRKDAAGNWSLQGFSKSKLNPFKLGGSNRTRFFTEWKVGRLKDADNDGFPEYSDEFNKNRVDVNSRPILYASTMRTGKYEAPLDVTVKTGLRMSNVYWQNSSTPWKDKAYQIISPGRDGNYGPGGIFTEDDGVPGAGRFDEEDNITNFSRSTLAR